MSLPFLFTPARTLIARSPFAFGLVALALVVVITDVLSLDEVLFSVRLRHPIMALEMFLLGWSACFARDLLRKTITGAAAVSIYLLHWSDVGPLITLMMLVGIGGILLELKIPLPTFLAKWFWRIGTMTMFLYLIHTPVISISSRLLPPDNWLQFTTVVIISLIIASSLRAGMNMIGRRIWRGQHVI